MRSERPGEQVAVLDGVQLEEHVEPVVDKVSDSHAFTHVVFVGASSHEVDIRLRDAVSTEHPVSGQPGPRDFCCSWAGSGHDVDTVVEARHEGADRVESTWQSRGVQRPLPEERCVGRPRRAHHEHTADVDTKRRWASPPGMSSTVGVSVHCGTHVMGGPFRVAWECHKIVSGRRGGPVNGLQSLVMRKSDHKSFVNTVTHSPRGFAPTVLLHEHAPR